jgi:hypothetical protein
VGKTKTLSYAEHQELAARVKEARKLLMEINLRVSKGLGKSSKAAKAALRILNSFDLALKHELDEALFRDCDGLPNVDPSELTGLYYGSTRRSKVVLLRPRNSH